MDCFWTRGYEAASVRDLAAGMGITGASLYNAFGDKRTLYRRALDHYAQGMRDRVARLEAQPPLDALRRFFDEIVERSATDPHHRGCMLVNAALEAGPEDAEFRHAVARDLSLIEAFFRRRIEIGQRDGSITTTQPAEALSRMLLSVLLGLRVLARTGAPRSHLDDAVSAALASIREGADVNQLTQPPHCQRRPTMRREAFEVHLHAVTAARSPGLGMPV